MTINSNINIETWNNIYSNNRSLLIWPDENIVSVLNRNKKRLNKGLDIACGAGRHTILMGTMGIESTGIDSSSYSIDFAKNRSKSLNLNNVKFYTKLVQNLELPKNEYDIVIMWGLLHYLELKDQELIINNVRNSLKKDGILLCTLRSTKDTRFIKSKKINKNRCLVEYFDENTDNVKQTLMYFWNKNDIINKFKDFSSIKLGHRSIEPIGNLGNISSHWLVEVIK